MDISKINSSVLRSLIKLIEKRDALVSSLAKVDAEIAKVYSLQSAPSSKGPKLVKVKASRRGRRGALKAKILAALRAAGDKGVAVKDLSKKLGVKNQNVHVWFSSTGKKLGNIHKISAGRYRIKAA